MHRKTAAVTLVLAGLFGASACVAEDEPTKVSAEETPADGAPASGGEGADGKTADSVATIGSEDGFVYDDGLEVYVLSAKEYTPGEYAAGHSPGNRAVLVEVQVVNGSDAQLDVSMTTVNARAGERGTELEQIIDIENNIGMGFSGDVAPGRKATATFAYSVPTADWGQLDIEVEPGFLDGYGSALFQGTLG